MIQRSFLSGVTSGAAATLASVIYTNFYFSIIVDFSEAASLAKMAASCFIFTMIAATVQYVLNSLIKNRKFSGFVLNLLISMSAISMVFFMLNADDPQFVNEDAQLMVEYYKGFAMPMLFFPALSWFTFNPLFEKK